MTNEQLLRAPDRVLERPDQDRRRRLLFAGRKRPCPRCTRFTNMFEASGVHLNDYVTVPAVLSCPQCAAPLHRVLILTGGGDWYWMDEDNEPSRR